MRNNPYSEDRKATPYETVNKSQVSPLHDLAWEMTALSRQLCAAIVKDDLKDRKIDELIGELYRLRARFKTDMAHTSALLFSVMSTHIGSFTVTERAIEELKTKRSDDVCVAIFKTTNEHGGVLKVASFDRTTYRLGDIDFTGITSESARKICENDHPAALALYKAWEEWRATKIAETIKGTNDRPEWTEKDNNE